MALHLLWDEFRSSFVKNLEALPVSQFNDIEESYSPI